MHTEYGPLVAWAFALKRRWHWTKYPCFLVLALMFLVLAPVLMLLKSAGALGDWLDDLLGL